MKKILLALLLLLPASAWAQPGDLVTEFSHVQVNITTRYTGDEITLFGAMSAPGQIVVKMRSPDQVVSLEKKGRTGPFWLSEGKHEVEGTPGLYYLLSSAPLDGMLPASTRTQYGLDLADAIKGMKATPTETGAGLKTIQAAVLRLKQARHYYVVDPKAVKISGKRLYSATLHLPSQLPLGKYRVDIYLVRNGQVVATDHRTIRVEEVQLARWISSTAEDHSWIFGVVFTFGVMLLGLFLGVVLGRGKKN